MDTPLFHQLPFHTQGGKREPKGSMLKPETAKHNGHEGKREIMNNTSRYDKALEYENNGEFSNAFEIYRECLLYENYDKGDIFFKCGWCLEQGNGNGNLMKIDAIEFYKKASEVTKVPSTKINSLFRSGWILMQEKQWIEAGKFFRQSLDHAEVVNQRDAIYSHALYWYAICLEVQGCFIDAVRIHRLVQNISSLLKPESCFREIVCLDNIGLHQEALDRCISFDSNPLEGFEKKRYDDLSLLVKKKRDMLEICLSQSFHPSHKKR